MAEVEVTVEVNRTWLLQLPAVPGDMDSLNSFRTQVIWRWYRIGAGSRAPAEKAGATVP